LDRGRLKKIFGRIKIAFLPKERTAINGSAALTIVT